MTYDDVLELVRRNEITQADAPLPDRTAPDMQCKHREFLMFSAICELLRAHGHSAFEADQMASAIMCELTQ